MLPTKIWSEQYTESRSRLNFTEIGWGNLMNECLIKTEICKNNEIGRRESSLLDPNIVMNLRHKMFEQSSKILPSSQAQKYTEALKLLRSESQLKLMKQKEKKAIEKEIIKLKQILENRRLSVKKEIREMFNKKIKSPSFISKFAKHYPQLQKELESHNPVNEVRQVHLIMATKTSHRKIFIDVQGQSQESFYSFFPRKNSLNDCNIENAKNSSEEKEKNESRMRVLEENNFVRNELKEDVNLIHDIHKKEIEKEPELQNKINPERLGYARTWKPITQRLKCKRRETAHYKVKIEAFLSNLQERQIKQNEAKRIENRDKTSVKGKIKTNFILNKTIKTEKKQGLSEEKEERIRKLMEEVKTSQADTKEKLRKIAKTNLENHSLKNPNLKFLQKIEKRRQVRLTRRNEIHKKKLMLKEVKEKAEKEKEEKKKQSEKEQKRKRLEELKEKQRLEKLKKLEQKRIMENFRKNAELAKNYYETYLLRSYGWKPWAKLLKIRDLQYQNSVAFHEKKLMQKVLLKWMVHVIEQVTTKAANAVKFYERTLKKNCLLIWEESLEIKKEKERVAVDWYEFKTVEGAFQKWLNYAQDERLNYLTRKEIAEQFYHRTLKIISVKKLQNYPKVKKLEQAMEIRKRIWREKVKEILPDYRPVDEFQDF